MGSVFSTRRRTEAVQPVSSGSTTADAGAFESTVPGGLSLLIAGLLRPVRRERCDQREDEDQHHHADEDEVRQRYENEAPVNVGGWRIHWRPPYVVEMSIASVCAHTHYLEGSDVGGME